LSAVREPNEAKAIVTKLAPSAYDGQVEVAGG